ncbi:MAG: DNA mismatch repair protein MutS, partial [Clostridia bacterium]|nr:DNA mismatch repair protein MutS [Clostridia bacterium]
MALTAMMQQYLEIKEQYPGAILFFRLGDFYEMFFEDAKTASRELELTLTGRDCGLSERAPMCGVPFHAVDTYLQRLIEKGYKVAICEQMTDPSASKGLVVREVTRVVTPGTVIEGNMLEDRKANYIASLYIRKNQAGCAFCDVSTGEFYLYQIPDVRANLSDEMARLGPSEVIVNDLEAFSEFEPERARLASVPGQDTFTYAYAAKAMTAQFGKSIADLGFSEARLAVCAAGALLGYLMETQKKALKHIMYAKAYDSARSLAIDRVALKNLELVETSRGKGRRGTLLWILDKTRTSMGSRLLRTWIERPLNDVGDINKRLDAVEQFMMNPMASDSLRDIFDSVYDVERLLSRIAYDAVNARDCLSLLTTLEAIPGIKAFANAFDAPLIRETFEKLDPIRELAELLSKAIDEEAPVSVRDGGMIREGYNAELDELRQIGDHGKEYLAALEARERERTGIKNLKIGYNRVFGYYIEVTKSFYELIPYDYTRKQTLANAERFITEELKNLETMILGAEENAMRIEYSLFCEIREILKEMLPRLQLTVTALKTIDALLALAKVAAEFGYVRPKINDEGRYSIINGRHPVVEESIGRERFVPNDTDLDGEHRVMIITGP